MDPSPDYLAEIGWITKALEKIGLTPILIGGMALVILGSRRVTKDFDFLVPHPGELTEDIMALFYQRGLQIASKLDSNGEIITTIDNKKVASIRLKLDRPSSAYFLNQKTGLRIDLLFDFPLPADQLLQRAKRIKVKSHVLHVASRNDLVKLKKLAQKSRHSAADVEDLAFLKKAPKNKLPKS